MMAQGRATCEGPPVTILVTNAGSTEKWTHRLRELLPDRRIENVVDAVDPADVEYVVTWRSDPAWLRSLPNLKAILQTGAGFDHLDLDAFPAVPTVRLVDPGMADDIALFVVSWVIHFQRDFDRFRDAQPAADWIDPSPRFPRDVTVGVLGAGAIGNVVIDHLDRLGFETIGWSRSSHDRPMLQFFADADIVVDLVPLSAATRGVIGTDELTALGDGVLVNVGRGATVDTDALLEALDGDLRHAVLDVFETEPLPQDSPLWRPPKVTVTPHIAGRTDPHTAAEVVVASIAELEAGRLPDATIPGTGPG